MNNMKIAAALRLLADAFETPGELAELPPAADKPKRGRGRPVVGEDVPTLASQATNSPALVTAGGQVETGAVASGSATTASITPTDSDPFADPPAVPTATLDQVREALTNLRAATSQDIAVGVLKEAGGVGNLTDLKPEKYGAVVVAARIKGISCAKAPAPDADPFGDTSTAAPAEKAPSLEDVKGAVVAATKRTASDTVQKVVMKHGGSAADPESGALKPSLKAIPVANYAACIKEVQGLPTTK